MILVGDRRRAQHHGPDGHDHDHRHLHRDGDLLRVGIYRAGPSHAGPRSLARSQQEPFAADHHDHAGGDLHPASLLVLAFGPGPRSSNRWPCRSSPACCCSFPTVLLAMPVLISFTVRHDHRATAPTAGAGQPASTPASAPAGEATRIGAATLANIPAVGGSRIGPPAPPLTSRAHRPRNRPASVTDHRRKTACRRLLYSGLREVYGGAGRARRHRGDLAA